MVTGLLLALLGALFAGIGARDQTLIVRLALAQGQRVSALAAAFAVSIATAAFAAWAGAAIAPMLSIEARRMLAWLALVIAGAEMLAISPGKAPSEPTHSLGAMAFVLAFHQVTDAARFLVFAVAMATATAIPPAIGGAIGGAITLTAGWLTPRLFSSQRIRRWRRFAGAAMLVLAAALLHRI